MDLLLSVMEPLWACVALREVDGSTFWPQSTKLVHYRDGGSSNKGVFTMWPVVKLGSWPRSPSQIRATKSSR